VELEARDQSDEKCEIWIVDLDEVVERGREREKGPLACPW